MTQAEEAAALGDALWPIVFNHELEQRFPGCRVDAKAIYGGVGSPKVVGQQLVFTFADGSVLPAKVGMADW